MSRAAMQAAIDARLNDLVKARQFHYYPMEAA
jgi:hypothetical protein